MLHGQIRACHIIGFQPGIFELGTFGACEPVPMSMRVVFDDPMLLTLEGVEGDVSPPPGSNPIIDEGVSSDSYEETLEP